MTTCKLCNGTGEWYGNDGQAGPFKCDPCPAPDVMPDEIGLGLFYAPAPMSERFYSVLDDETKMQPLATRGYIAKDIHNAVLALNDELLEALKAVQEIGLNDYVMQNEFERVSNMVDNAVSRAEAAKGE